MSTKTPHFRGQTPQNGNLSTKNAKSVDEIPDQVGDDGDVGDVGDDGDDGDGGGWRGGLAQYLELFAIFVKLNR